MVIICAIFDLYVSFVRYYNDIEKFSLPQKAEKQEMILTYTGGGLNSKKRLEWVSDSTIMLVSGRPFVSPFWGRQSAAVRSRSVARAAARRGSRGLWSSASAAVRTGSVASARHVGDINFNWNGDGLFNNLWDGLGNIGDFLVAAVWVSGRASSSAWVVVWGLSECHLGIWLPDWVGIFVSVWLQLVSDSSNWNNSLSNTGCGWNNCARSW